MHCSNALLELSSFDAQYSNCTEKQLSFFYNEFTKEISLLILSLFLATSNTSPLNNIDSHLPIGIEGSADMNAAIQPSEFVLSEKNKTIYTNNNKRLDQLERDIRVFHLYGNACDELLDWLKDDRAYSSINENALLKCITAIYEKYAEHGRWSGVQILKIANERCSGLSDKARGIYTYYKVLFVVDLTLIKKIRYY